MLLGNNKILIKFLFWLNFDKFGLQNLQKLSKSIKNVDTFLVNFNLLKTKFSKDLFN